MVCGVVRGIGRTTIGWLCFDASIVAKLQLWLTPVTKRPLGNSNV
jgi:hypothetical protein